MRMVKGVNPLTTFDSGVNDIYEYKIHTRGMGSAGSHFDFSS